MKTVKTKINIVIEKTKTGFSAYSEDHAIFTTARNIPELIGNTIEASNLYFEDEKLTITQENLNFIIDFKQFFQYYKVINAKFLAKKIGMNETLLSQYVQGRKKPSDQQTDKILKGIHQIGRELAEINLIHRI
jgi:transcriptional regulator with XRE-family HTH domain